MNLILQEDEKGCGLACVAMICGHTYQEAKAKVVPHCWGGQFTHYDAFEYFNLHGFSYQHWYRHTRFILPEHDSIFPERSPWPIATPFADFHMLLTRGDIGHWVAMDFTGEIYDPVRGRGKKIEEYEVMQIIGVWAGAKEGKNNG